MTLHMHEPVQTASHSSANSASVAVDKENDQPQSQTHNKQQLLHQSSLAFRPHNEAHKAQAMPQRAVRQPLANRSMNAMPETPATPISQVSSVSKHSNNSSSSSAIAHQAQAPGQLNHSAQPPMPVTPLSTLPSPMQPMNNSAHQQQQHVNSRLRLHSLFRSGTTSSFARLGAARRVQPKESDAMLSSQPEEDEDDMRDQKSQAEAQAAALAIKAANEAATATAQAHQHAEEQRKQEQQKQEQHRIEQHRVEQHKMTQVAQQQEQARLEQQRQEESRRQVEAAAAAAEALKQQQQKLAAAAAEQQKRQAAIDSERQRRSLERQSEKRALDEVVATLDDACSTGGSGSSGSEKSNQDEQPHKRRKTASPPTDHRSTAATITPHSNATSMPRRSTPPQHVTSAAAGTVSAGQQKHSSPVDKENVAPLVRPVAPHDARSAESSSTCIQVKPRRGLRVSHEHPPQTAVAPTPMSAPAQDLPAATSAPALVHPAHQPAPHASVPAPVPAPSQPQPLRTDHRPTAHSTTSGGGQFAVPAPVHRMQQVPASSAPNPPVASQQQHHQQQQSAPASSSVKSDQNSQSHNNSNSSNSTNNNSNNSNNNSNNNTNNTSQQNVKKSSSATPVFHVNSRVYYVLSQLGKGGSSIVYKVLSPDKQVYALKCIDLKSTNEASHIVEYENEINLLLQMKAASQQQQQQQAHALPSHDCVIQLIEHEYVARRQVLYMVLELGQLDFAAYLQQCRLAQQHAIKQRQINALHAVPPLLSGLSIRFFWGQMLRCVLFCHESRILHLDLKPANFVFASGRLKIIDFGIAKQMGDNKSATQQSHNLTTDITSVMSESQVGTLNYMSPETLCEMSNPQAANANSNESALAQFKIGRAADVWSLGCILYQLCYGAPPFAALTNVFAKMQAITQCRVQYAEQDAHGNKVSQQAVDCLKLCLKREPRQRATIQQLLQHQFLNPDQ